MTTQASRGAKIVIIGGGTGLSTVLRGLKKLSKNITAIVTVADDGGGSGRLRQDLGMLPPGDIRNCILALAETEPLMEQLLSYRFTEGSLSGQSFGNLFLAAMDGISVNFEQAVRRMSDVLRVVGQVLPVTLDKVDLTAILQNGTRITGESKISDVIQAEKSSIKKILLTPDGASPVSEVLSALGDADLIILGPGSLYTSVIPNLLVCGVADAIAASQATKLYICNIMTQPYETTDYTAIMHIEALLSHGAKKIDYCIVNNGELPRDLAKKYLADGASVVSVSPKRFEKMGIKLIEGDFVKIDGDFIRHDADKITRAVARLLLGTTFKNRFKRIADRFYIYQNVSGLPLSE